MFSTLLQVSAIYILYNHSLFTYLPQGQTGGFNNEARDRDLPFVQKDEPATLPRVTELILITELSPWCTIVRNERGVTMSDVCTALWKEQVPQLRLMLSHLLIHYDYRYTDNLVSDGEFTALPVRLQEQVKRTAAHNAQAGGWGYYNTPQPNRFRRIGEVF